MLPPVALPLFDGGGHCCHDPVLVPGSESAVTLPELFNGDSSTTTAGQVKLSSGCKAVRPRVTGISAWVMAESISEESRKLCSA